MSAKEYRPGMPLKEQLEKVALLQPVVLPRGTKMFHVGLHLSDKGAPLRQNVPYIGGAFRFSPFEGPSGANLSSYYAGSTPQVALAETVLRLPKKGDSNFVPYSRVQNRMLVEVVTTEAVNVFQLCGPNRRSCQHWMDLLALTESTESYYVQTRAWASGIMQVHSSAHGLEWMSRQDNQFKCWVFYDRNLPAGFLKIQRELGLLTDMPVWGQLLKLANEYNLIVEDPGASPDVDDDLD